MFPLNSKASATALGRSATRSPAGCSVTNQRALPAAPATRLPRLVAQPSQQQEAQPSVACRGVKFNAEMQALLSGALERSSNRVLERIGVPGLRLEQSLCTEQLTGQVVWETDIQLAIQLRDLHVSGKRDLTGLRILDLHAGLGLCGVTAAVLGANVTLTDVPKALPLTRQNAEANESSAHSAGGSITVKELDWDAPSQELLEGPWDMVIGADVVYEDHSPEVLAPIFDAVLRANPGAQILLSHAHRSDALDDKMTELFAARGLEIRMARRLTSSQYDQEAHLLQVVRAQ